MEDFFKSISIQGLIEIARVTIDADMVCSTFKNKASTLLGYVMTQNEIKNINKKIEIGVGELSSIHRAIKTLKANDITYNLEYDERNLTKQIPLFFVIHQDRKKVRFALKNLEIPELRQLSYPSFEKSIEYSITLSDDDIRDMKRIQSLTTKTEHFFTVYKDNSFFFIFSNDYKKIQNSAHLQLADAPDCKVNFSNKYNLKDFLTILDVLGGNCRVNFIFSKSNIIELTNENRSKCYILTQMK